jgi:Zn-dependent protease with chaperone function
MKNPGVLAHELGHHMGGKWLMRGNQIGRPALGLGTAGALLSNNEDNSRNSAIAGTVGSMPMLASEFDASRRGAKLMRQMKLKGGRSAFIVHAGVFCASARALWQEDTGRL